MNPRNRAQRRSASRAARYRNTATATSITTTATSPATPVKRGVVDRGTGGGGLYLSRALAVGDAPRFEVVTRQPETISDDDLRRSAAIVLNDVVVGPAPARPRAP